MEGIQTIQALKAVQSSLPAQTTIPSDELVMLYAADGTPIAKISRDDLVKAVASVMASNSQTTFSKLLGVQANGTPMGIGASDLASVLGVALGSTTQYVSDLNIAVQRAIVTGMFKSDTPHNPSGGYGVFIYISSGFSNGSFGFQIAVTLDINSYDVTHIDFRGRWGDYGAWNRVL